LVTCLLTPFCRLGVTLGYTHACMEHETKTALRAHVPLDRCFFVPTGRLLFILRHAITFG